MRIHPIGLNALVSGAAILVCLSEASAASLVYDNSVNYLVRTYSPGNGIEFGDEIFLEGSPPFTIAEFKFETFVGSNANFANGVGGGVAGDDTVNLRLLLNDGTELSPGRAMPNTQLYESGLIDLAMGFETHIITGLAIALPPGVNHLTWTAEFQGIDGDEQVGLTVYDPPVVGSGFIDFWKKNGSTWETLVFSDGTPASFGAQVRVPDRGSTALLLTLALVPLAYLRRKADAP